MKGDLLDYMRWTLVFGKYTGLMPIVGLESPEEIPRFEWKSLGFFIYVIKIILLIFMIGTESLSWTLSAFNLRVTNAHMFVTVYFILSLVLFRFCQRLKCFLKEMQELERLLPRGWKPRASVRYTNQLMVAIVFLGIGGYIFYFGYKVYITNTCHKLADDSGWYIKSYFMFYYAWYFKFYPFSYTVLLGFQIVEIQSGIMWFYSDWLVMCVSIYLRKKFEDFNRLIIDEKCMFTKTFKPSWSELQVHYSRLSKLVNIIDKQLNAIVFFTFTANLYFICLHIYNILNNFTQFYVNNESDCTSQHNNDALVITFKIYETSVLVLRMVLYVYLASEIHVESRKSLVVMHSTPPAACDSDMKRLMTQIYYSNLGLSGFNIFKITRGMILAIVAQLLTFELVVIQF